MKPVIAAFDFDGTLSRHDSLLPFLHSVCGNRRFWQTMLGALPRLAGVPFGLVDRQTAKEALLTRSIAGMAQSTLQQHAERFAETAIPLLLRPGALPRIAWHREQGHLCVLVSASPELYLAPWTQQHGFTHCLASRLEFIQGRATGRLQGANCRGAEKVRRLTECLGPLDQYTLYAYGDSDGDRELLAAAQHPYFRKLGDDAPPAT